MWSEEDIKFMRQAIDLADSALGMTSPDPTVGAVVVKRGEVVSVGYHGKITTPHAEAWAIKKAGKEAKGATLYVNLEPCCHYGNNPPCCQRIVQAGVKRVVAAIKDPNPLVRGKGFKYLRKHGVKVDIGLMAKEAAHQNEAFFKQIQTRLPFVTLKTAMTLDGKIASHTGHSQWITSLKARRYTHHLRNLNDVVVVGVNTVLKDDPELTVRHVRKIKNPLRLVLDSSGRTPLKAKVLNTKKATTLIVVSNKCSKKRREQYQEKGARVMVVPFRNKKLDLRKVLKNLGKDRILSVLVEGGGEVAASFLANKLVDKVSYMIAPKLLGGREAKTPFEGEGFKKITQAILVKDIKVERLDKDILVEGYLQEG